MSIQASYYSWNSLPYTLCPENTLILVDLFLYRKIVHESETTVEVPLSELLFSNLESKAG